MRAASSIDTCTTASEKENVPRCRIGFTYSTGSREQRAITSPRNDYLPTKNQQHERPSSHMYENRCRNFCSDGKGATVTLNLPPVHCHNTLS